MSSSLASDADARRARRDLRARLHAATVDSMTNAAAARVSDNAAEAFRQAVAEIAADFHTRRGMTVSRAISEATVFVVERMKVERPDLLRKVHAAFEAESGR